jgi:hypothetical protein
MVVNNARRAGEKVTDVVGAADVSEEGVTHEWEGLVDVGLLNVVYLDRKNCQH